MVFSLTCPICSATGLEELGRRTYAKSEMDQLDCYTQLRYRVLFEVWHPGCATLEFKCGVCRDCGFVCHIPRPSIDDVDRKYRFLNAQGNDYGKMETLQNSTERARRLFDACRSWLPRQGQVLDYGGGDGRLMECFSQARHDCFLVDYNPNPQSYVSKICDTLDEFDSGDKFHGVIVNHVLEHLADPVAILSRLRRMLLDGGFVFVEVPMEIWRNPPFQGEPVTHLNFFVTQSLARCLQVAGFGKVRVRQTTYLNPSGRKLPAVQAWARCGESNSENQNGYDRVCAHLEPNLSERLRYVWSRREDFVSLVRYRLFGK